MAAELQTPVQSNEPPLVFVSYSKDDRDWLDKYLLVHLGGLEKAGLISAWSDSDIDKSGDWLLPLVKAMTDASVAICLISPNYLNTEFCLKHEIPFLIERAEKDGLNLLMFLLDECAWQAQPWLAKRQLFLPKGQSVVVNFKGKENVPFTWLTTHINELLGEHAKEADNLPVSEMIQEALAALKADVAKEPEVEPMPVIEEAAPRWPILAEKLINIERLPVTGAELFGRHAELQMLDEAWESETTNIVSLVAWGGVGKSTLLNKWVEYLASDNYRGARRIFAWSFYSQGTNERVTSADEFVSEALTFFGEGGPAQSSPWAKGERLAELVGQEKALLLLDGMEPLQDQHQGIKDPALSRLIECLAEQNDGLCLITTRESVKEFEDFPGSTQQIDLEQISPEAGRSLLRVKGIRGSDAELEAASEAFGNHALAINLLASFLKDCEGKQISHAAEIPDLTDLDDPNHRHPRRVMAAFAKRFGNGSELDLLHVMGLFDRPANRGCIAALRAEPAIPGLTEKLLTLEQIGWRDLLDKLRDLGLLAPASHHAPDELDAHPIVREHFDAGLRAKRKDAWKAGHQRLYEYLKTVPEKHQPDTLAEMAPLFQAVHHGCLAGRLQEALSEVYRARIIRHGDYHLFKMLGAFGTDLGLLASFFEVPWKKPRSDLNEPDRAMLPVEASYRLRALGQLEDAIAPLQKGLGDCVQLHRSAPRSWRIGTCLGVG